MDEAASTSTSGSKGGLSPREAFLVQALLDAQDGTIKPLHRYLREFTGDVSGVAAEYLELIDLNVIPDQSSGPPNVAIDPNLAITNYRLLKDLGHGGQGIVYLAEDLRLGRTVAVKVLDRCKGLSDVATQRFLREATITSRLDHPGICPVFEVGVTNGAPFIVMKYVAGESLADCITKTRDRSPTPSSTVVDLPEIRGTVAHETPRPAPQTTQQFDPPNRAAIDRAIRMIEDAARTLHAAHERGVIHRDIKPANIMVTPDGYPVILDFGLARDTESELPTLSRSDDLFGTPPYMSPEQLSMERMRVDRRTDVWSLGVTLFECLTLQRPFVAPTQERLAHAIQSEPSPDVRRLNENVPHDLRVVLETALEKDRHHRYQTALDFAEDLRRVRCSEPIRARPVGAATRLARWAKRNPASASLTLALFVTLATAAGVFWSQAATLTDRNARLEQSTREAEQARAEALMKGARLARSRGLWQVVLDSADGAAAHGWKDATEVSLLKIEAWYGQLAYDRMHAELARLDPDSSPTHRASILLARGDLGSSPLQEPNDGLTFIKAALDYGGLSPDDAEYARALVTEDLNESERHLRAALTLNATHRRANETLAITLVALGRREPFKQLVTVMSGLYPDDPQTLVLQLTVALFERNQVETDCLTADLRKRLSDHALEAVDALVRVIRIIQNIEDHSDQLCNGDLLSFKGAAQDVTKALFVLGAADPASVPPFIGRFPRAAARSWRTFLNGLVSPRALAPLLDGQPKQLEKGLNSSIEIHRDGFLLLCRSLVRMVRGTYPEAMEDAIEAASAPALIQVRRTALRTALATASQVYAAEIERTPSKANATKARIIKLWNSLRERPDLTSQDYFFGCNVLMKVGLPMNAATALGDWVEKEPDNPDAAVALARFHLLIDDARGCLTLATEVLRRHPGHGNALKYQRMAQDQLAKVAESRAESRASSRGESR